MAAAVSIRATFWGTRGSLGAPLDARGVRSKLRAALIAFRDRGGTANDAEIDGFLADLPFITGGTYGGNTSCVQLDCGDEAYTLCDAGSGLRVFSESLQAQPGGKLANEYNIFLSHVHWDHISGFPFFRPAYIAGNVIRIYTPHPEARAALERQHGAPSFPVPFAALPATIEFVTLEAGRTYEIGGFEVRAMLQNHPGDSYAFRFSTADAAIVYATDSEHRFRSRDDAAPFVELFRDADAVIFDAMYSLGDSMTVREDWGHSSNVVGVELAQAAGVRHLILFHHDPASDDRAIDRLLRGARRFEEITRKNVGLRISAAYDGLEVVLPSA